ncbi:MAG: hypothetical protein ACFFAK_17405 [Promethearchaeota archaeon]
MCDRCTYRCCPIDDGTAITGCRGIIHDFGLKWIQLEKRSISGRIWSRHCL